MSAIKVLSVAQVAEWRAANTDFCLVDVREPEEVALCQIPDSLSIPLAQIGERIDELPTDRPVVLYCHHGRRSERAAQYLEQQGLCDVHNLSGGIDAWALAVDPDMARY